MIRAYEEMVENIKAFDDAQGVDDGQLTVATAEVEKARQRYNSLLEEALENPELAADVVKAQGMVTILETKLQRLQARLAAEKKPYPDGMAVAFQNVQGEIRRRIEDGSLLSEEFQPLLEEMNEHRQSYMAKLKLVYKKMVQQNKSLAHIQHSTASAVTKYTGKEERFGLFGPVALSESDFTKWAWVVDSQYSNDLYMLKQAIIDCDPDLKLPPLYNEPNERVIKPSTSEMKTTFTQR